MPGEGQKQPPAPESIWGVQLMLQTVQQDTKEHAVRLAEVQAALGSQARELAAQSKEMENLVRLLRGNNGSDGLQTRTALLEKAVSTTAEGFKELREMLEAMASENVKGRWTVVVGVMTGLIGLVGIIVAALLKH